MRDQQAPTGSQARMRRVSACLLVLMLLFMPLRGWPQPASESAVKAAFLYKFASFVEWPAGAFKGDEPLQIGVMANDGVATELGKLVAGRNLDGRPIVVRRLRDGEDTTGLHVLMVGAERDARLREVVASTPGPVLLVAEQENGLRLGAVLNFVPDGGRVRFTASIAAAEARGLRLSARLLSVAQTVEGRAR